MPTTTTIASLSMRSIKGVPLNMVDRNRFVLLSLLLVSVTFGQSQKPAKPAKATPSQQTSAQKTSAAATQLDEKLFSAMKWRQVGPFRGGRVLAVTGVPGEPNVFYF